MVFGMYSLSRCLASSLDVSKALMVSGVQGMVVEDLGHVDSSLVRGGQDDVLVFFALV